MLLGICDALLWISAHALLFGANRLRKNDRFFARGFLLLGHDPAKLLARSAEVEEEAAGWEREARRVLDSLEGGRPVHLD
ncbi:hypothetical protein GE09DRAFT_1101078 [Coniochaeta sp. 2T2.1]|nr:hypothetical protein GE09DRAFT_1101078 [Coniochaeta sp. 2T2.1]